MVGVRVLVTGAHGFIGRHVARHFARRGAMVVGMGHSSWTPGEWQSWGLSEWHETDISPLALERHAGAPEVVAHCAGGGSVAFSFSDPAADFHRTVTTTSYVMDYLRRRSPSTRVVYPSSASVYGIASEVPISTGAPCAPISPYGVHKWIAEQVITYYGRHFGISAALVRLFSVYGCGLRKQLLWDACQKLSRSDSVFMGTGDEVRDWLHVDDAAELLVMASAHANPAVPLANGGTGQGVSVRQLLAVVSRCLSVDSGALRFSESPRPGDPSIYVADNVEATRWGWRHGAQWEERVAEYVAWWQLEMGVSGRNADTFRA